MISNTRCGDEASLLSLGLVGVPPLPQAPPRGAMLPAWPPAILGTGPGP